MCKRDMQTVGLREGDEGDRAYWKETIPQMTGRARGKKIVNDSVEPNVVGDP